MDALSDFDTTQVTIIHQGVPTSELWEVILVAACPVVFIIFLCICVACLVFKGNGSEPQRIRAHRHRGQISRVLRNPPPPPSYHIAVKAVDAPPPVYVEIEKDGLPAAFRTTPSGVRPLLTRHLTQTFPTPTLQPVNIQYLFPPRYEPSGPVGILTTKPREVVIQIDASSLE